MGSYDNRVAGFETINGSNCYDNSTSVKKNAWFNNGDKHTCVVKVRRHTVMAFLDDKLISQWKTTDFSEMGSPYPLKRDYLIGVGGYKSTVVFTKIEVLEVTGHGTVIAE